MKLFIPELSRVTCSAVLYIVKLKNEDLASNTAERGSGGQDSRYGKTFQASTSCPVMFRSFSFVLNPSLWGEEA
jgi:hypothetical protein